MTEFMEFKRRTTGDRVFINTDHIISLEDVNVRRATAIITTGDRIEVLEKLEDVLTRLDEAISISKYGITPVGSASDTGELDKNLAEITERLAAVEKSLEPSNEPPAENVELKAIADRVAKIEVLHIPEGIDFDKLAKLANAEPGPVIELPEGFDLEAILKRLGDVEDLLTSKPAEAPTPPAEPAPATVTQPAAKTGKGAK